VSPSADTPPQSTLQQQQQQQHNYVPHIIKWSIKSTQQLGHCQL